MLATAPADLPAPVLARLGRYQVAEPADFVASIRTGYPALARGVTTLDLDGDGRPDFAVFAVDRSTREFRFVLAVSRPDGGYDFPQDRHYRGAFDKYGGIVYAAVEAKAPGDDAWADKLYSRLPPDSPERAAFKRVPAIALWRSIGLDPYNRPDDFAASSLDYCRDVFYYLDGKPRTWMVCQ